MINDSSKILQWAGSRALTLYNVKGHKYTMIHDGLEFLQWTGSGAPTLYKEKSKINNGRILAINFKK